MADTSQESSKPRGIGGWKLILAIALIIAYTAGAAYGVMSDTSARGLTVKMYSISRSCSTASSSSPKTLTYSVGGAIWSSSSLPTSLTLLSFTLSVDGTVIGTTTGSASSFGAGQSTTFNLAFTNSGLNPTSLPKTSQFVLDLMGTVASGLYRSTQSASDTILQSFGTTAC